MDINKLKGHIPDSVISQIPEVMTKFQIDTPIKLAHFLAQCKHESGGFKLVNENLNYGASRLLAIFPKYFNNETAILCERKPEKIANIVYGNRMGNGDKATGDGYKFHGRGYIQLTGRTNYIEFSKAINEDVTSNPDLVATKYPLLSAAWFFHKNCLGRCKDATDESVISVTKCVNGGTIGLSERLAYFKEYYTLLA
jgi:putative chitinase